MKRGDFRRAGRRVQGVPPLGLAGDDRYRWAPLTRRNGFPQDFELSEHETSQALLPCATIPFGPRGRPRRGWAVSRAPPGGFACLQGQVHPGS